MLPEFMLPEGNYVQPKILGKVKAVDPDTYAYGRIDYNFLGNLFEG